MVELGQVVVTCGVAVAANEYPDMHECILLAIAKHKRGDWGDLGEEDKEENNRALKDGNRLLSSYPCPYSPDAKIWVITEWDRSVTTVLFPSEY